ncbi:MAG TPA: flagellar hook-length control protein FliK [Gammaproteobacteria bacterium]|nr:flagellar hook-length control protein FliK [Gammaproteobacteria bacterium]
MNQSPLQTLPTVTMPGQVTTDPSASTSENSQPSEFTEIINQSVSDLTSAQGPPSGVGQSQTPEPEIPPVSPLVNMRQELPPGGSLRTSTQSQADSENQAARSIQSILSEYDLQSRGQADGTGEEPLSDETSDLDGLLAQQESHDAVGDSEKQQSEADALLTASPDLLTDPVRSPGLLTDPARTSALFTDSVRTDIQGQQAVRENRADNGQIKTSVTSSAQLQALQGNQENLSIKSGSESSLFNNQGGGNLFNGEQPGGVIDKNADFSSLLDKGVIHAGKGSVPGQVHQVPDSAVRGSIDSLKQTAESFQLKQHVSQPGWKQEFGERMMMMTRDGVQSATLRLNPANLGSIEVKISIQNDHANITFTTHQGAVKDMIDATLPRLRDMMQDSGVKLENASVSDNSRDQGSGYGANDMAKRNDRDHPFYHTQDDDIQVGIPVSSYQPSLPGLQGVDFYA